MSYCEIFIFEGNKIVGGEEWGNSWGGAAYIWTKLYDKYLKDPTKEYDSWLGGRAKPLWGLYHDNRLSRCEKAALLCTFDYAMVDATNYERFSENLAAFVQMYPPKDEVCHLPSWAEFIKTAKGERIGFYHTSVSENLWLPWDHVSGERIPYNFETGTRHFEIYLTLEKHDKDNAGKPL